MHHLKLDLRLFNCSGRPNKAASGVFLGPGSLAYVFAVLFCLVYFGCVLRALNIVKFSFN